MARAGQGLLDPTAVLSVHRPVKHLKSSLSELRRLFARSLSLRDIAEPLISFDDNRDPGDVLGLMVAKDFDVIGRRERGVVTGYFLRPEGRAPDARLEHRPFGVGDVLADTEPLVVAADALVNRRYVFVTVLGQVGGIVTRGDLQKAPVRLWLFGLVSLLEMHMLRIVRERYPDESWASLLSLERLEGARRVFAERRQRNEATDLSDCLQLGDKATVFRKDAELYRLTGFPSRVALEEFLKSVAALRNALAHANDILQSGWPAVAQLAAQIEELLERLESAAVSPGPHSPA